MKFGLLYNIDYHEEVHGTPSQYYGEILEQAVRADELGYHSVWFGEHHYDSYSFGSPGSMCLAAANKTSRIKVGTGVAIAPLHHPILFAEEYGLIDVLSGGRLELGVGRGFVKYAFDILGIDPDESEARYREALEFIIQAWTSKEPFSFDGSFWKVDGWQTFPPPIQHPSEMIFATATSTPETFTWNGRMGLNLATTLFSPDLTVARDGIVAYRQALQDAGVDPKERQILGVTQMYCGETNEEARDAWQYTNNYLNFFSSLQTRRMRPELQGDPPSMEGYTFETYEAMALFGDPERIIEKIRGIDDYYDDLDIIIMEVAQGGLDPKLVIPTIERFAKYVMPEFSSSHE